LINHNGSCRPADLGRDAVSAWIEALEKHDFFMRTSHNTAGRQLQFHAPTERGMVRPASEVDSQVDPDRNDSIRSEPQCIQANNPCGAAGGAAWLII
jgi:hypothetical protein